MLMGAGPIPPAQTPGKGFLDRVYVAPDQGDEHRYVVFVPEGDAPESGWPVVLFLHGAGERGTDGRKQVTVGLGPAIRQRAETFPAVVVFPQADFAEGPILETWRAQEPGGRLAMAILEDVERNYPIDPRQRTVTGWSMGAYGALSLGAAHNEHWSKVLSICGGGEVEWAESLAELPVWIVHGGRDAVVPVTESRTMAAAFDGLDHQMTFTEVAEAGHDLCTRLFHSDAVLDWMVSPDPTPPTQAAASAPEVSSPDTVSTDEDAAFQPALVISRAMALRLGNNALQTLVEGLPESLGEDGLSGTLNPVNDQVEYENRTFDVRFEELTYRARLHRAILGGRGAGRMQLSFAVRDFEVQIGRIEVSDSRDGVVAGPVTVVIGHREPVWLEFEVRPLASPDGRLQLQLLRSQFAIPDHNWYVKPPERIAIRGELFSEDTVRTAIVGGVYVRKATIERQILGALPVIVQDVERRLDFSPLASFVTALWPLPVYSPQIQVRLEETSTDTDGVSLVFGCTVASLDGTTSPPEVPARVTASSPAAANFSTSTDLQAAVSLDVIGHLSSMVAGSDAVRLYATDVPGRPFQELDDVPSVLAATNMTGRDDAAQDVRTQFLLSEPFSLRPVVTNSDAPSEHEIRTIQLAIDVPRLSLEVFCKSAAADSQQHGGSPSAADGQWSACGGHEVSILQPISLTTQTDPDRGTTMRIDWQAAATVRPRGDDAESVVSSTTESSGLSALFRQGWTRWASHQAETEIAVPDVAVGPAMLRFEGLSCDDNCLTAAFQPSATTLVNRTDRPVHYCVRGPHSRWSREYTIPPHTQHVYRVGYPLHVRPGGSPSPMGQPLALGTYDWSPGEDPRAIHWVRRAGNSTREIGSTRDSSASSR